MPQNLQLFRSTLLQVAWIIAVWTLLRSRFRQCALQVPVSYLQEMKLRAMQMAAALALSLSIVMMWPSSPPKIYMLPIFTTMLSEELQQTV
jgi:hypothetical protein